MASFGETIRKRRQALGLNQTRLGELVGKSAATVRAWEQGKARPSDRSTVSALAAILGVDQSTLSQQAGFAAVGEEPTVTLSQAYASLAPAQSATRPGAPSPVSTVERLPATSPPPILLPARQTEGSDPSYMEIPSERRRYQQRAIVTTILVAALVIVLLWSFRQAWTAFGELWNDFLDQLDF